MNLQDEAGAVLWGVLKAGEGPSHSLGYSCPGCEGAWPALPDSSLSPQNASTFEEVVQVPSAYQKTVPIEAGESWQSESTVWYMGCSVGAPWSPRHG